MSTLFDTFSGRALGAGIPEGWQSGDYNFGTGDWAVEEEATFSGRVLRKTSFALGSHHSILGIRPADSIGNKASTRHDIIARVRVDEAGTADGRGTALFANSVSGNTSNGILACLLSADVGSGSSIIVGWWVGLGAGGWSAAFAFTVGEYLWLRFNTDTRDGFKRVKAKVWKGDFLSQPSAWLIDADISFLGALSGRCGLGEVGHPHRFTCDYYAAGFDGTDAPPPPEVEAPGPIAPPLEPFTENGVVGGTQNLSWGVSPFATDYRLQYLADGVWTHLAQPTAPEFEWDTSVIPWLRTRVRVRGESIVGASPWLYSPPFTIWQGVVGDPAGYSVSNRTGFSVMLTADDFAGLKRVEAQLDEVGGDFSAPLVTVLGDVWEARNVVWITSLKKDHTYRVRLRAQDLNDNWLDWFDATTFRTLNIFLPPGPLDELNAYYVKSVVSDDVAMHGFLPWQLHSYMNTRIEPAAALEFGLDFGDGTYGIHYPTRGIRLQMGQTHLPGYVQPNTAVISSWNYVRLPRTAAMRGAGPRFETSMLMAFVPLHTISQELMGAEMLYLSSDAQGRVFLNSHPRPTVNGLTMETTQVGEFELNTLNVLYMGWRQPHIDTFVTIDPCACQLGVANDGLSPALVAHVGLNGAVTKRDDEGLVQLAIRRPSVVETEEICGNALSCVKAWQGASAPWYDFGRGSPWPHGWMVPIGGNGEKMRGILVEAAVFPRMLSDGEIATLTNALLSGDDPRTKIIAAGPAAYLPFDEYPAPNKPVVAAQGA